jgi:hypothetical protein
MPKRRRPPAGKLINTILADRQWFQDGKPCWIEGKNKRWERPCQTAAAADQLRCDSVRLLRRHGKDLATAEQVAERLDSCSKRYRCLSGACSECSRAQQRWFVSNGNKLIQGPLRRAPLVMVTIAPDFGQQPMDRLNTLNTRTIWLKSALILRNYGIDLAFGGSDFSVNMEWNGRKPYLQVHFTLFIPKNQWPKPDKKLRKALNPSRMVKTPVRVETFDGNNAGLAYALKYRFNRRVGFQKSPDVQRDRKSHSNTRNRPLRGPDWMRLMVLLDRISLDARICLIGTKRILKNEEVVMRLIE